MLVCTTCNHKQETGKFCGVCGSVVTPEGNPAGADNLTAPAQSAATMAPVSQPTDIKDGLQQYGSYFLSLLKNPSLAFQSGRKHFISGFVTLIIYAIAFSLSIYFLANSLTRSFMGGFGTTESSLPFFELNFRLFFIIAISMVISLLSSFIMVKAAKNHIDFQTFVAQFGGLAVPFVGLNVLAILFGLAGSIQLTMYTLGTSLILFLMFVPVIMVYDKATLVAKQGQRVYLSLATVILMSVLTYIVGRIMLADFISDVEDLLYYVL
ncbi:hypothetical protein [Oceanobacillus picturae]|uniref:hypothetical protein n=1 Tax=Oceanobacillus picturae TaxID=171693 RepID=UPI003630E6F5